MYSGKMVKKLTELKAAIKAATTKGGVRMAVEMADIHQALNEFLEALNEDYQRRAEEEREAEEEEWVARATYDLHHRRLIGLVEEIRPLARKRPDSPCNAYKLQQVNEVLSLLKEELDTCFNADLPPCRRGRFPQLQRRVLPAPQLSGSQCRLCPPALQALLR